MAFVVNNLNPSGKKTSDSHIRAVAAACNITWDEAFKELCTEAFNKKDTCWDPNVVEAVLLKHGFKIGRVKVTKGSKRPTVYGFAEDNPGIVAVLRISGYFVACAYGNYIDTYDCGSSSVYKYWYKEIK